MQPECIFENVPDERNDLKKNQRRFICFHGKVLSWQTARRVIGLPSAEERLKDADTKLQTTTNS